MTDSTVLALATMATPIATGIVAYFVAVGNARLKDSARKLVESEARQAARLKEAAAKVDDVRRSLDERSRIEGLKLDDLSRVAESTHALVNSNMAAQLRLTLAAMRRVAELTRDPDDVRSAEEASRLYAAHMQRQADADAGSGSGITATPA
jgi:hypothetical protein